MRFLEFFKRQLLVAHIFGIPVRVDYRWFFVLALMSWITANSINPLTENFLTSFIFGIAATLIFFASIFLHELAHAVVARMESVQVLEIVLHPFGGLTRFRHEPKTPRAEFRIAVAGPVASFLLALLFLGLMAIFNSLESSILAYLFFTLVLLNFFAGGVQSFSRLPTRRRQSSAGVSLASRHGFERSDRFDRQMRAGYRMGINRFRHLYRLGAG